MPPLDGARIRRLRLDRGLDITTLAHRARCSRAHLANIEAGRRTASPALTKRLARTLRTAVAELEASP
jgi:transcriptional regulator with XRE-family HTH domain